MLNRCALFNIVCVVFCCAVVPFSSFSLFFVFSSFVLVENMDLLRSLEGTFAGKGSGSYPTIKSFEFREEVVFEKLGSKNIFSYRQKTWNLQSDAPMHTESGFLRVFDDHSCELVVAQATGVAEVEHGKVYVNESGIVCIDLQAGQELLEGAKGIVRGDHNKEPRAIMIVRRFQLHNDSLKYKLLLATSTTPKLTHHIECDMARVKK